MNVWEETHVVVDKVVRTQWDHLNADAEED